MKDETRGLNPKGVRNGKGGRNPPSRGLDLLRASNWREFDMYGTREAPHLFFFFPRPAGTPISWIQ